MYGLLTFTRSRPDWARYFHPGCYIFMFYLVLSLIYLYILLSCYILPKDTLTCRPCQSGPPLDLEMIKKTLKYHELYYFDVEYRFFLCSALRSWWPDAVCVHLCQHTPAAAASPVWSERCEQVSLSHSLRGSTCSLGPVSADRDPVRSAASSQKNNWLKAWSRPCKPVRVCALGNGLAFKSLCPHFPRREARDLPRPGNLGYRRAHTWDHLPPCGLATSPLTVNRAAVKGRHR